MKIVYTRKIAVVCSDTAQGFEEELNKKMAELAEFRPKVEFNMEKGHCAYLMYEVTEKIAENIKDEYEVRGDVHKCWECPCLQTDGDMRKKYFPCAMSPRRRMDSDCCLYFYRKLEKGEIEL